MNMLDDWQRVKSVFEQALAVDEAERSAFLAAACGSDALLRQRVDALLASHAASSSFLETSASAVLELPRPGADLSGQTLGTYRLLSRIGAGAMGEVYAAHDEKLDRRVAVKLIATDLARDVDRLQRFRQEAHAASSLNHPNIVVVHDFGEMDVRPFIVTELVEGVTLRARLEKGPLPIPEAIEIALQVTSGLAAAHARGLVHRDIKPENVMVRPDGFVKVLDFGLAKLARAEHAPLTGVKSLRLTQPGQMAGTPAYMSPEQARAEPVTAGTDVFSVGAVLYEMVTGRPAFAGESPAVIFAAILGQTPPAPTALNPNVPPELERLITKALEKDRELRYQSVADMRADLLHLRRTSDAAHLAASTQAGQRPVRAGGRAARQAGGLAWVALALVVLVSGLAAMAAFRRNGPVTESRETRAMLAVLPFENLSEDAGQEYLAHGLTEEMTAQLGQLQPAKLGVIARTSTARYKQTKPTAAQIGRELGVDYLLDGSVRRAGDRVRVIAQLVDASKQTQLWSETYERPVTDVLAIQKEIADHLVRSLSIQLLPARASTAVAGPVNPESYDKYLLGLHEIGKGTREGGNKAIAYFKEAIAKNPDNARIHAALAQAYTAVTTYYSSPTQVMPLAREAAQRALSLDPELAAAHVTLANVRLLFDWDWSAAERGYQRALEINPNLPEANLGYATYLATLGRFDEAIARVKQAYRFDPLALESRNEALWIYYFSGRFQETVEQSRRTIDLEPAAGLPYVMLALAHAGLGERADAVRAAQTAVRLSNSPTILTTAASALARAGQRAEARQLLSRALALAEERYVCRFNVAAADVDLGDTEQAFESLEEAYLQRSG
jgi:TolB-like protein/tetratricopeptide (TPR) repeat protein/tRNA A-37 threonylcarbamoyl transferase component Bud32